MWVLDLQLFAEEKREQPTQRRREEARRRGQVAKSNEIGVLTTLVAGTVALRIFGPAMVQSAAKLSTMLWSGMQEPLTQQSVTALLLTAAFEGLKMMAPVLGMIAAIGLASEFAQVGFLLSSESVAMNLSRVDPFKGMERLFSKRSLMELLKSLFKFTIVAVSLYQIMGSAVAKFPELMAMPIRAAMSWGANIIWNMVIRCALGLAVIAAADYVFNWREHEQSLKMSRHDVQEELKQSEGRPEVRQRIRQRQRQMATGRMMDAVKKADVVVANPDHFAVALAYDGQKMAAPQVLAKGAGWLAQRIKEEAKKHKVAIVENRAVARALYFGSEVGESVPPSLYQAVAEILAFVYRLRTSGARR